jgi:hypothetical protein
VEVIKWMMPAEDLAECPVGGTLEGSSEADCAPKE